MNKKLFAVVLTLALIAGGVGLGIHLLHKQALAEVVYTVEIWDNTEPPGEWLDDGTVFFSFDERENWVAAVWVGGGEYEYERENGAESWWIRLDEPPLDVPECDPNQNPFEGSASSGYQFWVIVQQEE